MNTIASLGMHKMFDKFDMGRKVYALISAIGTAFTSVNNTVKTWVKNSDGRRDLARLDARMLKDIGLEPYQVWAEVNKPFWQS